MQTAEQMQSLAQERAVKNYVFINGLRTDYWVYPATAVDPKKAKNILLVHGYRGDHHGLESFAGGLAEFNVYAPDLPGFGSSAPLEQTHSLENYANWLVEFLKEIKLQKPIAIGHSFGTLIISSVQAEQKLFPALVCINPVAGGITKGLSRILMQFVKGYYFMANKMPVPVGLKMLTTNLLVDTMSSYTTKSSDKPLRRWIKNQHRMHFNSFANSHVVWESYLASVSHVMQPFAKHINTPVLLVAAELDEVTPVSEVIEMSKSMTNARMIVVPNCGHLVHYEAAFETVNEIKRFIADSKI